MMLSTFGDEREALRAAVRGRMARLATGQSLAPRLVRAATGTVLAVQTFLAIGNLDGDAVSSRFEMACGVHTDTGYGHAPIFYVQGTELE